ncbi:MAG: hypothetical protein HOL77_02845 [Rhodobacteraceae bacterium]|jgi:heterotetrameric sarcosine oxidase gamma subunit|nr:hypothetical protein [Paracoccaceae bacterium]
MMLDAISPLGHAFGAATDLASITLEGATERSDLGAVLCVTTSDGAQFAKALGEVLGCALPTQHGKFTTSAQKRAIWLSPRSWVVLCDPLEEAGLVDAVAAAYPDHAAVASRFTDALGWILLDGNAAEMLLRQGSFLSFDAEGFPVGHAKRTLVAEIPAVILRETETKWLIGVERSRTRYFADWLGGLTHSFGDKT